MGAACPTPQYEKNVYNCSILSNAYTFSNRYLDSGFRFSESLKVDEWQHPASQFIIIFLEDFPIAFAMFRCLGPTYGFEHSIYM
jgi:hypothetical protein